jgi:hypothetical protein
MRSQSLKKLDLLPGEVHVWVADPRYLVRDGDAA